MQRANDLVDLHYGFKLKFVQGNGEDLRQARKAVDGVLQSIEKKRIETRQK